MLVALDPSPERRPIVRSQNIALVSTHPRYVQIGFVHENNASGDPDRSEGHILFRFSMLLTHDVSVEL